MVFRIYSEKKKEYGEAASALASELRTFLGIGELHGVRIINRYDVEGISEELFRLCAVTVFSEPQVDNVYYELPEAGEDTKDTKVFVFAVEYLPGQFDQRADSAAQCISLVAACERPIVRSAVVYMLTGELSCEQVDRIKRYIINPVDSREAELAMPDTLKMEKTEVASVGYVPLSEAEPGELIKSYGLAMDEADVMMLKDYFASENREPTVTELRVIDTYWSDHCRHTTFNTEIVNVEFEDERVRRSFERYLELRKSTGDKKSVCLMDLACIAAKALKKSGELRNLDESDEINACTVRVDVDVDGKNEPWLLLFKNETHNHPTEIEPFGGAATCVGGAIRDPLSGRSYVYNAMRITGCADPLARVEDTIPGKLPQKKLVTTAAAGYSSYGNQIGLATGLVDEVYHPGYVAKHMEIGAVVGAAPCENVRRDKPCAGDKVILLGGRTGRDGCGGATGSSKSHTSGSLASCGAEVQKGNAPEERKLQRLFSNSEATRLIKCCNDFGAGGVSVAIGELADGLEIDLDAVPKKYEGLDGTELAISESQERMAVVVDAKDADRFLELAYAENLEATIVAEVNDSGRMVMNHGGRRIVDLSREFLNTNGARKRADAHVVSGSTLSELVNGEGFAEKLRNLVSDINICSRQGLSERFDSTIGAGTVLMPFGGKNMLTPPQVMAAKFPVRNGETDSCSVMSYGFDPYLSEADPYEGAYCAVVCSVAKLVASGAGLENCYLTFQEYFEKLGSDKKRWGKPLAALLGALDAQMGLRLAAIGGKDSMSGSFEELHVPPTLVSFAIAKDEAKHIISPEFKAAGHPVVLVEADKSVDGLPDGEALRKCFELVHELIRIGKAVSAWTLTAGGIAEGIFKMAIGNGIGFRFLDCVEADALFGRGYGSFILELAEDIPCTDGMTPLGFTTEEAAITLRGESIALSELRTLYDSKLESVYRHKTNDDSAVPALRYERKNVYIKPNGRHASPHVLIPVFPGTNCEFDSARAMRLAGAEPEILVINNLSAKSIEDSVNAFSDRLAQSQILFIPGGFSGGDEPEGSAKLIASFMRSSRAADGIMELISKRDGLILGICNGFQALVKLGLVPFGRIMTADESCPTLTYNTIGLHRSRLVHTRAASNLSPWLMYRELGSVATVPVSHGEGRFVCSDEMLKSLIENGQIAFQYCDADGVPSMSTDVNPNGSVMAIEGITSPDGRVLGKMAHSERTGNNLYRNVPGEGESCIFRAAVDYFRA